MNKEKFDYLNDLTKEEYTQWLVGYLAGIVSIPIEEGVVSIDGVALKKLPALIDSTYKNVLVIHDYLGLNKEHYKIFSKVDDFETEVGLFYIQGGETITTPFTFKLESLQKSNLN